MYLYSPLYLSAVSVVTKVASLIQYELLKVHMQHKLAFIQFGQNAKIVKE